MGTNEKDTAAVQGRAVSNSPADMPGSSSQDSIIQRTGWKNKGKQRHALTYNAKPYSVAIKCYEEQCPAGFDGVRAQVCALDKADYQALCIVHNRDLATDGIWATSYVKPHLHLILRCTDRTKRFHLPTMLSYLGIYFRPGVDDKLWENGGVESVGKFAGYAMYLTHETDDAIADGKELYSVTEITSNLTAEEVQQVRDGYIRVGHGGSRLSPEDLAELDEAAFRMGYALQNFDEWFNNQPFAVRSNAKIRVIRESYARGVDLRVSENTEITRLCIYIQGQPNTGKTYAAKAALAGMRVLSVGGGGSGKFDNLRPDHQAIIIDDDVCPNLLNMTDNYVCRAYRRNKNNPVWAGSYIVVTSNLSFDDWLAKCGIKVTDFFGNASPHGMAMHSRFYICKLCEVGGVNRLGVVSPSTRGSPADQQKRLDMFQRFAAEFNNTISQYRPAAQGQVDYSGLTWA